jgi:hypothetical protein
MTASSLILELLDDIRPDGRCDDCLSGELAIQPRQTINQLCRLLASENRINRTKRHCDGCGNHKITNSTQAKITNAFAPITSQKSAMRLIGSQFDVEKCRTDVVRICVQVWRKTKSQDPPRSISQLINQLRNENLLPSHPANMMLTLCGLRNVYVYEGLEFTEKEFVIVRAAHEIVSSWWKAQKEHNSEAT